MSKTKYRKQEVPELYNKRLAYTGQLLREYRWGTSKSRQQIEKEFGSSLVWERIDEKRACRIKSEIDGNLNMKEKWDGMIEFMIESMINLERVMKVPLVKINNELKQRS